MFKTAGKKKAASPFGKKSSKPKHVVEEEEDDEEVAPQVTRAKGSKKPPSDDLLADDDGDGFSQALLLTDPREVARAKKRLESAQGNELWRVTLSVSKKSGPKAIQLRKLIGYVALHNIPARQANGMVGSEKHVCTAADGKTECAYCDAGFRASIYALYSAVDINGYTRKDGQKVRNTACFLLLNESRDAVINSALISNHTWSKIKHYVVKLTAQGNGATAVLIPTLTTTPVPNETKEVEDISKKVGEYFSPQPYDSQKKIAERGIALKNAKSRNDNEDGFSIDGDD